MTKRMLIDATHAEETRVVVLDGNRLDDFDVETAAKKQLKGNIYLAKVVRVEPSLQAAFVEYGGGRHGFLAFGEIHPDYYQIPVADRQRLLEMQEAEARAEEEAEDAAAAAAEAAGSEIEAELAAGRLRGNRGRLGSKMRGRRTAAAVRGTRAARPRPCRPPPWRRTSSPRATRSLGPICRPTNWVATDAARADRRRWSKSRSPPKNRGSRRARKPDPEAPQTVG